MAILTDVRCEVIPHCGFDLHSSNNQWWWANIYCACWPSMCLLWRYIYLGLLPEENIDKTFLDINCSNIFLDQSPKAKEIKAKINKRDLIKFKNSCTEKETINKIKRQPTEWKKILANEADWQGLNFQNIQTAHTIQYHKTDSSIKKQAEDLNRHVSKMANKNTV